MTTQSAELITQLNTQVPAHDIDAADLVALAERLEQAHKSRQGIVEAADEQVSSLAKEFGNS